MKIKGLFKDISGYFRIIKARKKAIKSAKDTYDLRDNVFANQKKLHLGVIKSQVLKITKENVTSVRIRLSVPEETYLIPGTYLSLKLKINDSYVTRPYSVITSPEEVLDNGYVEIIVKEKENGFVSPYLNKRLKENDEVLMELNQGEFTYQAIRDKKQLVFIAGGVGITPFISLSKHLINDNNISKITILFGAKNEADLLAVKELDELAKQGAQIIYVMSEDKSYKGEKGLIDKNIIQKYVDVNQSTFFICGPSVMIDFVKKELEKLNVDIRKVRTEGYLNVDIKDTREYQIEVRRGLKVRTIKAFANESVLTAIERSGLKHDSSCRSGRCGFCHIRVIKGDYLLLDDSYIRYSDKQLGYVHSCITYPKSDMVIQISIE